VLQTNFSFQGLVWKFEPLWMQLGIGAVEPSVVKLDYGKVSASDISSFNIALWYEKLHELI